MPDNNKPERQVDTENLTGREGPMTPDQEARLERLLRTDEIRRENPNISPPTLREILGDEEANRRQAEADRMTGRDGPMTREQRERLDRLLSMPQPEYTGGGRVRRSDAYGNIIDRPDSSLVNNMISGVLDRIDSGPGPNRPGPSVTQARRHTR